MKVIVYIVKSVKGLVEANTLIVAVQDQTLEIRKRNSCAENHFTVFFTEETKPKERKRSVLCCSTLNIQSHEFNEETEPARRSFNYPNDINLTEFSIYFNHSERTQISFTAWW